ncbi:MAG: hypothetical protein K4571_08120 [Deltaproteobacteria bacterium]
MLKKLVLMICAVILLGAVSGCERMEDPFYGTGDLTLYNNTSLTISAFYLTPVNQPSWGPNRLEAPVPSGTNYTMTGFIPGTYDAKATIIGALSTYYGYIYDIPIYPWETTDLDAYNSDFSGSVEIVNDTAGANITGIYISPTGSGTWGPNQITSSIGPGQFFHFYDLPADSYDIRIVWNIGPDSFYYSNIVGSLTLLTLYVN